MARPKSRPATPSAPVEGEAEERVTIVNLKGSPDYAAWLDRINRKTHIPKTTIFRLALESWAKANGHEAPPEI